MRRRLTWFVLLNISMRYTLLLNKSSSNVRETVIVRTDGSCIVYTQISKEMPTQSRVFNQTGRSAFRVRVKAFICLR